MPDIVRNILMNYRKDCYIWILYQIITIILSIIIPLLNRNLIDVFLYNDSFDDSAVLLLAYMVVILLSSLFSYVSNKRKLMIDLNMQNDIRKEVIFNMIDKRKDSYSEEEIGELDSKIKIDVLAFQQYIFAVYYDIPFLSLRTISTICVMALLSWQMTGIVLVMQIIIIILQSVTKKYIVNLSKVLRNSMVNFYELLNDVNNKISYIKAIGAEKYIDVKYDQLYSVVIRNTKKQFEISTSLSFFIEYILEVSTCFVVFFGGILLKAGSITLGTVLSFIQYIGKLRGSVYGIYKKSIEINENKAKYGAIIQELSRKKNVIDSIEQLCPQRLIMSNIYFKYKTGKVVFKRANATFDKGKINCVFGSSGSGKSTIIKLILNEYKVDEGSIYIENNHGVKEDKCQSYCALVPQENVFFTDTIYNNITLGRDIDDIQLTKICIDCGILDDIKSTENGFDTLLSNGLLNFSGGQLKKIAIARALVGNKEIILLDEPTAGLDENNAKSIIECIKRLSKIKLVIAISHDICLIKEADKAICIANCKMSEIQVNQKYIHET